jgi:hypothetical protein
MGSGKSGTFRDGPRAQMALDKERFHAAIDMPGGPEPLRFFQIIRNISGVF